MDRELATSMTHGGYKNYVRQTALGVLANIYYCLRVNTFTDFVCFLHLLALLVVVLAVLEVPCLVGL